MNPFPPSYCRYCGKLVRSFNELQLHDCTLQRAHSFVCQQCNLKFSSSQELQQHVNVAHYNIYQCNICFKTFKQKCHLLTHLAQHTGDKRFVCSICEKAFARKDTLDVHMKTHNADRAYECAQCGEKFK